MDFTERRTRKLVKSSDHNGHGTHVAGIIGGAGDGWRAGGRGAGRALLEPAVLGADGSGYTSDVIEAIDWAIEHKARTEFASSTFARAPVLQQRIEDDPLCEAVERAVAAGLVVVAAAGNFGKTPDGTHVIGGIASPGNSPFALTVGALNTQGHGAAL